MNVNETFSWPNTKYSHTWKLLFQEKLREKIFQSFRLNGFHFIFISCFFFSLSLLVIILINVLPHWYVFTSIKTIKCCGQSNRKRFAHIFSTEIITRLVDYLAIMVLLITFTLWLDLLIFENAPAEKCHVFRLPCGRHQTSHSVFTCPSAWIPGMEQKSILYVKMW